VKKVSLSLFLAVVMLVAVFVPGCGKQQEKGTATTTTEAVSTKVQTPEPVEVKKELEISIAFWDLQEFGNDEIGKKIQDDLKIKIKPVTLSWDNDQEQIKLFGASGSMPDLISGFTVEYDISRFYSWLDQGLTRTIPEELVSKYSNVKMLFDKSNVGQAVKKIKGAYCYIPRAGSLKGRYVASQIVTYYRKDWLQNVGIAKAPGTMDEFYQMLKAFTYNDPNKNSKADTYGLTTAGFVSDFFAIWGINPNAWVEEDGKLIPGYMSKKCIEPLKYFRKLYEEKIYDPEFPKNGYKQAIQKITTNIFGSLTRNGDLYWINKTLFGNWGAANTAAGDPLTVWGILDPLKMDENTPPAWPEFINASGTEVSAKVDDEKLDRCLELLEYIMDPDNRNMLRFGFEGVDYKKNGDKIERTIDPATNEPVNIISKYPSTMITCLSDWDWDNDIDSPYTNIPQSVKDIGQHVRDAFNAVVPAENRQNGGQMPQSCSRG
jgi:ABC-type glycerol-3-phosphate transport system substrate-binding protein